MKTYLAADALLPGGWARDVRIVVDDAGDFSEVTPNATSGERLAGPALPGMANLHSHAFQRAMAGLTEVRGTAQDDFWTWRELMYRFDPQGRPYAAPAEMLLRHLAAARETGIAVTLLPSLYAWSNFGARPLEPRQARFASDPAAILRMVEVASRNESGDVRVGVAPHSLRAADPAQLEELVASLRPQAPIHIHVAEQEKEVDDCLAWCGKRPVEWLLARMPVDARWCVVHATHMTGDETAALARSGAVTGLCPSTEADLGDGIFPLLDYRAAGGRYGIGGDSHVSRDPAGELRLLEYAQRLAARRRNLVAGGRSRAVGTTLWLEAAAGGAQALGRRMGAIAPGMRADLVVLEAQDPDLTGRSGDAVANALVFSGAENLVRDVMVGGNWVVSRGCHALQEQAAARFKQALGELLA